MHPNRRNTFKALGIMLCYPSSELIREVDKIFRVIADEAMLLESDLLLLQSFVSKLKEDDLIDSQENYVETFDRVKSLSLHLFEHVHGESRDRGQAMVDLSELYKESGLELDAKELPDYLPVFLEYLSRIPQDEAVNTLQEPIEILKVLAKRLAERSSPYSVILNSLLKIAGHQVDIVKPKELPAMSYEQLDKEWEEKPIIFLGSENPESKGGCGGNGGCGGGCYSATANSTKTSLQEKPPLNC